MLIFSLAYNNNKRLIPNSLSILLNLLQFESLEQNNELHRETQNKNVDLIRMLKYFMEDMDVFWYLFIKTFSYDTKIFPINNLISEFIPKSNTF